jgi:hypothetical protein
MRIRGIYFTPPNTRGRGCERRSKNRPPHADFCPQHEPSPNTSVYLHLEHPSGVPWAMPHDWIAKAAATVKQERANTPGNLGLLNTFSSGYNITQRMRCQML